MNKCKGKNCMAIDGNNHSQECMQAHEDIYSKPTCFERAIDNRNGGKFDNCKFYRDCKSVKPICLGNST